MVDMDHVNASNPRDFLNATIRNFEEMMDEVDKGLSLARERQITFVKTGQINTKPYEATKEMIEELEQEMALYREKLRDLRRERDNL